MKIYKKKNPQNLDLIEHKLCINNHISETGTGEPLVNIPRCETYN